MQYGESIHIQREVTLSSCLCLPFEKATIIKGKNLLPYVSKYFPFTTDPFSEEGWVEESKHDVTQVVSLGKKKKKENTEFIKGIKCHLKCRMLYKCMCNATKFSLILSLVPLSDKQKKKKKKGNTTLLLQV